MTWTPSNLRKEKEKTMPFGVNLIRSQGLYWAARDFQFNLLFLGLFEMLQHTSVTCCIHVQQLQVKLQTNMPQTDN